MVSKALFSSDSAEWSTPSDLFSRLDEEFHFTLDPAATIGNAKCPKYYTKDQDGLQQDWGGETVFVNPPYSRKVGEWVKKAYEESLCGAIVVMLLPARTDTRIFHDLVLGKAEIRFIRGRLKFGGSKNSAPFPSMLAIYRPPMSSYSVGG